MLVFRRVSSHGDPRPPGVGAGAEPAELRRSTCCKISDNPSCVGNLTVLGMIPGGLLVLGWFWVG